MGQITATQVRQIVDRMLTSMHESSRLSTSDDVNGTLKYLHFRYEHVHDAIDEAMTPYKRFTVVGINEDDWTVFFLCPARERWETTDFRLYRHESGASGYIALPDGLMAHSLRQLIYYLNGEQVTTFEYSVFQKHKLFPLKNG